MKQSTPITTEWLLWNAWTVTHKAPQGGIKMKHLKDGLNVQKKTFTGRIGGFLEGTHRSIILAVALLASSCHAAPAPAGSLVTLPVTLSTGSQPISALQFDLDLPVGVSTESVTTGSSAIAAQKQISANMVNGDLRVIISGLNQSAIPSGPIAQITLRLASSLPTGSFPMNLSNVAASDPGGLNVPLSSSLSGLLSVIANVMPFLKVGSN